MNEELVARLKQHRALSGAPVEELEWLVEHGTLRTYAVGDVITAKGERAMERAAWRTIDARPSGVAERIGRLRNRPRPARSSRHSRR